MQVVEETEIAITEIVKRECSKKQELFDAKLIKRLIEERKIKVEKYNGGKEGKKLGKDFNIEEGEISSLLLAKKKGWILATDDRLAIKTCKIIHVPFLTTVHFLLRLYQKGVISREIALAKVEVLKKVGRYNPEIIRNVSRKIMEKEKLKCRC